MHRQQIHPGNSCQSCTHALKIKRARLSFAYTHTHAMMIYRITESGAGLEERHVRDRWIDHFCWAACAQNARSLCLPCHRDRERNAILFCDARVWFSKCPRFRFRVVEAKIGSHTPQALTTSDHRGPHTHTRRFYITARSRKRSARYAPASIHPPAIHCRAHRTSRDKIGRSP